MPHKDPEQAKEYHRRYYQANKERKLRQHRLWCDTHKDHLKAYCEENKERIRVTKQTWYAANRERQRLTNRTWLAAHPEFSRTKDMTRRARKNDAFVESVNSLTVFDRDGGVCQICLEPIGETAFHIDHVVPLCKGGEHSYANVQLTHAHCNLSKGSR